MHGRLRDRQRAGLGLLQECTIECMRRWNKPALWGPNEGGRSPGCSATHSTGLLGHRLGLPRPLCDVGPRLALGGEAR